MEYLVLQNTRLSVVTKMAEVISRALQQATGKFIRLPEEESDQASTIGPPKV